MKELRGAIEQIRGQVAGLIVHPPCRVGKINLAAGTDHFEGTEPVQNSLDFDQIALGQHQ
jgi:hypothetical protein